VPVCRKSYREEDMPGEIAGVLRHDRGYGRAAQREETLAAPSPQACPENAQVPAEFFRFAAFISYASADAKAARRLHRALERYRIPKSVGTCNIAGKENRIAPIFRDRDELPSGEIRVLIEAALRTSSALIVIASPSAARSEWVEREIQYFRSLGRADRIFALILSGDPNTLEASLECFPPSLRASGFGCEETTRPFEVVAGDLRPGGDGFRVAFLKVIAGIIGVSLGRVLDRDSRIRRRRSLIAATAAVASAAGLFAGYSAYDTIVMRSAMLDEAHVQLLAGRPFEAARFAVAGLSDSSGLLPQSPAEDSALVDTGFGFRLITAIPTAWAANTYSLTNDGTRFLTKSNRDSAALWNIRTGQIIADFGKIHFWILYEAYKRAIIVYGNNEASLWNLESGRKIADLGGPGEFWTLHHNEKNGLAISISQTSHCTLWDILTGANVTNFPEMTDCVGVSSTGASALIMLKSTSKQGAIFSANGRLVLRLQQPCDFCLMTDQGDCAMAIDSRHANRATIYHVPTGRRVGTVAAQSTIRFYLFNKDGRRLVLRDSANRLTLWDTERATLVSNMGVVSPNDWVLLQGGKDLLVWKDDQSGTLWDVASGQVLHNFPAGAVYQYRTSSDGKWLLTLSRNGRAELWDLITGDRSPKLPKSGHLIDALFSPDSTRLVLSSENAAGYIWDLERRTKIGDFNGSGADNGDGSKFSGDGRLYLTATEDDAAALWDAKGGVFVGQLGGPGVVDETSVSYDGSTVATISTDHSAAIWDTTTLAATRKGGELRNYVCSINYSIMEVFGDDIRGSNLDERSALSRHVLGRPWHPCDWRGLLSAEGWAQFVRLWFVRLGIARDYDCSEVDALGHTTEASRARCSRS
jgi:WD40 repeat protein